MRRSVSEPGSTMPVRAIAASSAAIFRASGLMAVGDTHGPRLAHVPHFSHIILYTYSVAPARKAPASGRAGELIAG